jgi:hypothetical protein
MVGVWETCAVGIFESVRPLPVRVPITDLLGTLKDFWTALWLRIEAENPPLPPRSTTANFSR